MEPSSFRPYWTTVESSYSNFSTHVPSASWTALTTWSKKPWLAVQRSFLSSSTVIEAGMAPTVGCWFRNVSAPDSWSTLNAITDEAGFLGPRPSVLRSSTEYRTPAFGA